MAHPSGHPDGPRPSIIKAGQLAQTLVPNLGVVYAAPVMSICADDSDEIEFVPIPFDKEMRRRLTHVSRLVGKPPLMCAEELFRQLLFDDDFANVFALTGDPPQSGKLN
jgi:hypothetical protein